MIRIVIDSSADYPAAQLEENKIELIPIGISIGEESFVDKGDVKLDALYALMDKYKKFPKTSQPSPQAFLELFNDAKEKGNEVICILLSSALSGTFQSAVLAKDIAEYDKIYLIDSLAATGIIKIMADYACRLRDNGISAEEIVTRIEELKPHVHAFAAINTLEYLSRGGRISKAAAAVGELANIKPIITVTREGEIGILGKCIGKNKAIRSVLKHFQAFDVDPDFPLYSVYSSGVENCQKLEDSLAAHGVHIDARMQLGSTIGTHIGPEGFGVIFVSRN